MNTLIRNLLAVLVLQVVILSSASAQFTFIFDDLMIPQFPLKLNDVHSLERRVYRYSGGICYTLREGTLPDITTFVTTFEYHLRFEVIDMCLKGLEKAEFEPVIISNRELFLDFQFEGRTNNLTCTVVGIVQYPTLYQVRFSNRYLTGGNSEIDECTSKAYASENKIKKPKMNFGKM